MQKMKLEVSKTARIHQIGEAGKHIKKVWLVLHGYGMLTEYFIRKFEVLNDGETLVLAPEGLSRFYLSGTNGRVGASWMTKDDRDDDIRDNMDYLDTLYQWVKDHVGHDVTLTVLGFSQGSPTACRWMLHQKPENARLMVWASDVPADVLQAGEVEYLNTLSLKLFVGDNDEYISEERLKDFTQRVDNSGVQYQLIRYEGHHSIFPQVLKANS